MTTNDLIFTALVLLALPAALLYPVIYVIRVRWWESWIGRALLLKATGVLIMLTFSALRWLLGPDYPGRDAVRIVGMVLVVAGVWLALIAMLRELRRTHP